MKIVVVKWLDAWFEDGPLSIAEGTALCNEPFLNEDVGFVLSEEGAAIVLAHERGSNGECDGYVFRHITTIPKCCIVDVKELPYG